MVGIVLISHSQKLAEDLVTFTKMMAPNALVAAAGGLDDGSFGTSYDKIEAAVESVAGSDGVVLVMDLGSSVMTAKMVAEDLMDEGEMDIRLADCPFVEGAVQGTVLAQAGADIEDILASITSLYEERKL